MSEALSYDTFVFDHVGIDREKRRIELAFSFDDSMRFTEYVTLPQPLSMERAESPEVLRALRALHLIAGVSYYKATLPRRIEVRGEPLDAKQAEYWNTFYTKGLGEFFYRNSVDFRDLVQFPAEGEAVAPLEASRPGDWKRGLVPWGGGKDSVVTVELLRESGVYSTLFRLGSHHFIDRLAGVAGLPLLNLERRLDPQLFELNKAGALNGHVPITTYMSFLTVVVCLLGTDDSDGGPWDSTFFSSERSADFGNIDYLGMQVNHQWSKSLEAEQLIRSYISTYVTGAVDYVNLLRPLSELSISRIFSRHPEYFDAVTSCNTNWRILDSDPNRQAWCGKCPKCAFVFAMLSAFLPADRLTGMFGKNLYADPGLVPLFRELWGGEGFKPFECVGTPDETTAAMFLATEDPAYAQTPVLRAFSAERLEQVGTPVELVARSLTPDWSGVPDSVRGLVEKRVVDADS